MNYYVSVVIISFNTKEYIRECLESVFTQDFSNFEVIIVDNASTDGTIDVINEYVSNKDNVKFIKNGENLGGASAGNIGITNATGEYVFIMDSDDIMPAGTLSSLYNLAKKNNSDIVVGRAKSIYGNKIRNLKFKFYSIPALFCGTYTDYRQCKELLISPFYWGRLYKTDFLKNNNIYMPEKVLYADLEFTTKAMIKAKKITVCDKLTYIWRRFNQDDEHKSITNSAAEIDNFSARIQSYYDLERLFDDEDSLRWVRMCNLIRLLIPITALNKDEQFAQFYLGKMNEYLELITYSEIVKCPYLTAKKKMLCFLIKEKRFEEVVKYSDISFETYDRGKYTLLCENSDLKDIPSEYLRQIQHKPLSCVLVDVKRTFFFNHFNFEVNASDENVFECMRAIVIDKNGREKRVFKIEENTSYFTFSIPSKFLRNSKNKKKCRISIEMLYNQNFCSKWLVDKENNYVTFEI